MLLFCAEGMSDEVQLPVNSGAPPERAQGALYWRRGTRPFLTLGGHSREEHKDISSAGGRIWHMRAHVANQACMQMRCHTSTCHG